VEFQKHCNSRMQANALPAFASMVRVWLFLPKLYSTLWLKDDPKYKNMTLRELTAEFKGLSNEMKAVYESKRINGPYPSVVLHERQKSSLANAFKRVNALVS
jgi:hypothetical protein